ncbi:MAG: hypothetical protein ABIK93_07495 [candidate division WOR-3 bacterium]
MNFKQLPIFIPALLVLNLVFLSCDDTGVLYRATGDYFPLKKGTNWQYFDGNDTIVAAVVDDTIIYGYRCILVYRGAQAEFWQKDKAEIRKLVEKKVNRAGYDFLLETQFRLYFSLPLIMNNSWHEVYSDTLDIYGDTIAIKHIIRGKVVGIEDIVVPAGRFTDVYQIALVDSLQLNDSLAIQSIQYWLAHEVGIIKQRLIATDTLEQVLIQFVSPDLTIP